MTLHLSNEEINTLDGQVTSLMDQKPIPEHEVKALCEKVSFSSILTLLGQRNYLKRNQRAASSRACDSLR